MQYLSAKPDKKYTEMNNNKSLIRLSKDEVITLLGKPKNIQSENNIYILCRKNY